MKKRIFQILAIIGIIVICIMAFTIPKDPYKIIPAITYISFDKPLWFCIILSGGFIYLITLYYIYDKITK